MCRRVRTPVEQIQPFERSRNVGLRESGWTYRRITLYDGHNVSVVCHYFQQWSVEHSRTRRPGSRRPRSTNARQDRRIVLAVVAARTASRAAVAPTLSPRAIRNRLLAVGLRSHVHLAMLPLTPRHLQARLLLCHEIVDWRVENGALLSSMMRVGSVCMGVMYVTRVRRRPGERHFPECMSYNGGKFLCSSPGGSAFKQM